MPCGYRFHAMDANGVKHAPSAAGQAAWWSDASGIPPGALADRVRAGVAATRAGLPRAGLPVLVMHGADDGLVVAAFSGAAYARWATSAGRDVRYWRVANGQHFDAFLGLPALGSSYVPMLPYAYRGLDAMWAHLAAGKALPGDAEIVTSKRQLRGVPRLRTACRG